MGDEMLVCEVCGEVLEGSENSYSVNYAGYYTHVCVACYEGESGLTLCKGCGEDADYCLISEEELISYKISHDEVDYTCNTMIDMGFYKYCSECGELWPAHKLEYGVCPSCEYIEMKKLLKEEFCENE